MNCWLWVWLLILYSAWPLALPTISLAQITVDGSLGPTSDLTGPDYVIPAEVGRTEGQNLFHSFETFHVPTGGSATFLGPGQIRQIVGRVTGGEASLIDGVLRSEIPGASLFLMNPRGIVFGVNAQLDVGGSFYVSTADVLRFEDGTVFEARFKADESTFSVRAPEAFGFLKAPLGEITIRSQTLAVPGGQTLGVTGGAVTINRGQLQAGNSVISLTSVAAAGEVPLSAAGMPPLQGVELGKVTITNRAALITDGTGGGVVAIRSGQLTVSQSRIAANNSGNVDRLGSSIEIDVTDTLDIRDGTELRTDSVSSGRGGDLTVSARVLSIADSQLLTRSRAGSTGGDIDIQATRIELADQTLIGTQARGRGQGGELRVSAGRLDLAGAAEIFTEALENSRGGDVLITADQVVLSSDARINSQTSSQHVEGAGNLLIRARESLQIRGAPGDRTGIFAQGRITTDIGEIQIDSGTLMMDGGVIGTPAEAVSIVDARAGNIRVMVKQLRLQGGAVIDSSALGETTGGNIIIQATEEALLTERARIVSGTSGAGDAGMIDVDATRLTLANEAQIASGSSGGTGQGGNITITADAVDLSGEATIAAGTSGAGDAGRIEVDVTRLRLSGGAQIASGSVRGPGLGGDVAITARQEVVVVGENTSIRSNTLGSGSGGSIALEAPFIMLDKDAVVTVGSTGTGDSGSVRVVAQELKLHERSTITAEASRASGGDISIQADLLRLQASQITSAVQGEMGTFGGDITINAPVAVTLQDSAIRASAVDGNGGSIDIETGVLLQDFESIITATATIGINGVVGIRAVTTNISGTVTPLSRRFATASPLSKLRCAQRLRGGEVSSFVVASRAGLPVDPSGGLPSLLVELPQAGHETLTRPAFDQRVVVSAAAHWYPCPKERLQAVYRR